MDSEAFGYCLGGCPYGLGIDVAAICSAKRAGGEGCGDAPEGVLVNLLEGHQLLEGDVLVAIARGRHICLPRLFAAMIYQYIKLPLIGRHLASSTIHVVDGAGILNEE